MFHPLELFIGLRYTRAKRRNHFISVISVISIMGIALGVATLIIVLSVMNGFEKELRERILGMASHATISPLSGALQDWPDAVDLAKQHEEVEGVSPYIEGEVMMNNSRRISGAIIRGVLPKYEASVSEVPNKMLAGEFEDLVAGEFNIVLGRELALLMGVRVGDKVTVITPHTSSSPIGIIPRLRRFNVVGVFEVGMLEYDRGRAFIHMQDAAKLLRLPKGGVHGVRLKLQDMFRARIVASELAEKMPEAYWIEDWTRRHSNFFKAVQMERRVMFVILTLILTVAAFNIVSTLIMVVTDKQSDIAILRTLGASPGSVMKIFMVNGTIIGVFGTLIGAMFGVLVAANIENIVGSLEALFSVKFIDPNVYYISELPSDLRWPDVIWISSVSFGLSVVATLYPAWRASKVQPAEALRYE